MAELKVGKEYARFVLICFIHDSPCGVKWNAKDTKVNRRISSYPIDKTCPRNPVCIDYVNKALMFQFRIHQERPISSSQTFNIIFHLCPYKKGQQVLPIGSKKYENFLGCVLFFWIWSVVLYIDFKIKKLSILLSMKYILKFGNVELYCLE